MDNRLKEIVENLDSMKIGIDDTFKFHCNQCGKCCINRADILLNPRDVYNMSKELRMTPADLTEEYCESYLGESSHIPIVRLLPRGSIMRCPLLKDRKCSVHNAKPTVCAMFPLGRFMSLKPEDLQAGNVTADSVGYLINPITCGDRTETQTVREWLTAFNIPIHDEFYIEWNRAIGLIGSKIKKLETLFDKDAMNVLISLSHYALYLNYDMSQEFPEQFHENWTRLQQLLSDLIESGDNLAR